MTALTDADLDRLEAAAKDYAIWKGHASVSFDDLAALTALARRARRLEEALLAILDGTRRYLPPDGISKDDLINIVIGATDNQRINPVIVEIENGRS